MRKLNVFLIVVLLLTLFAELASAQSRPGRGNGYGRPELPRPRPVPAPHRPYPIPVPRPLPAPYPYPAPSSYVTCSAADTGWEEHWSGHATCRECEREHGRCIETCSEQREIVEVTGVDYAGRTMIYRGEGRTRYEAESEAIRACQWNSDMRSCTVSSQRSDSRTVSRRDCPQP